jgi:hypothetical protein
MVGLLNIGKLSRSVPVRGVDVEVTGISAKAFLELLDRFKELQAAMSGQKMAVTGADIMKLAPEVIAAIIAAGVGCPNDKEQEDKVLELLPGEQLDLILAIVEVSLGSDIGPFKERLGRLGIDFSQNPGTVPDMKSPGQLNGSSGLAATPKRPSGLAHPDS